MAKRIIIAQDVNGNDELQFLEGNILQGTLKMVNLTFVFSRSLNDGGKYTSRDVLNNSSEQIFIGDIRYDRAFFIDYVIERGTSYEAGQLTVVYKEGTFSLSRRSAGDDCGLSLAFSVDGNNITLTATSTDATSDASLKLTTKTIGK